ncbi:PIG-L deacetylase family protein [Desertimonas flava]|jgi:LmbE family N-acetylglucosaminyl deacetylase|uniref:PIG-L deacetylase family protein n=1 Tax=Desertimonas flava TaxID=2064846 RepID=UPI000E344CAA|nr:PIG-L deacetylase family protein [Desertimonas flava]
MNAPTTIAMAGERMVVVVAHPDDESFGCGSLIAAATAAGAGVTVLCATRGEAGERRPDPVTDTWPLGLLREVELCQAAMILGVDDVEILDYGDSGFSGPLEPGSLVATPIADVARTVGRRLAQLEPDVVLTLDGSDGHRDHQHLRDALHIAVASLDRPVRIVHSCLARSLMSEWAAVMTAAEPDREHLGVADLGRPDDELVAVDTSAVLGLREKAIACHLSQASPFEALPPDLRRRFLTTDFVVEHTPDADAPTSEPTDPQTHQLAPFEGASR